MLTQCKYYNQPDEIKNLLADHEVFIFDCDGTIWLGDKILPGAIDFLEKLKKMRKRIYFYTNNCMTTRAKYVEKMKKHGLDISINQVNKSVTQLLPELPKVCVRFTQKIKSIFWQVCNLTPVCAVVGSIWRRLALTAPAAITVLNHLVPKGGVRLQI